MSEARRPMTAVAPSEFPDLFRPVVWPWGPTRAAFEALDALPPAEKIANVNVVPYVGDRWLILRLSDGSWEIPGGTLEPGEDYYSALCRELLEEAGAALASGMLLGAWDCYSEAPQPYRPHIPHPDYYRVVICGEVKIMGRPLNPPGGESVASVELVSLDEAAQRFCSINRPDLADLYRFAAHTRQQRKVKSPTRFGLQHLYGISRLTLQHFDQMGISTLEEVASMTPQQLIRFRGIGRVKSVRIRAHAEALLSGEAIWHAPLPEICRSPGLMLDIETEFDPGKPWSFGWQKVGEPVRISVVSGDETPRVVMLPDGHEIIFLKDAEAAWELIAQEAASVPGPIYHWSKYEVGVLNQSAPRRLIEHLEPRLHDLLETYQHTVTMPVTSFSIKTIGAHLGQKWPPGEDAMAAWMAYLRWRDRRDHQLLVNPCAYLRADVAGLMLAWQWISQA